MIHEIREISTYLSKEKFAEILERSYSWGSTSIPDGYDSEIEDIVLDTLYNIYDIIIDGIIEDVIEFSDSIREFDENELLDHLKNNPDDEIFLKEIPDSVRETLKALSL